MTPPSDNKRGGCRAVCTGRRKGLSTPFPRAWLSGVEDSRLVTPSRYREAPLAESLELHHGRLPFVPLLARSHPGRRERGEAGSGRTKDRTPGRGARHGADASVPVQVGSQHERQLEREAQEGRSGSGGLPRRGESEGGTVHQALPESAMGVPPCHGSALRNVRPSL